MEEVVLRFPSDIKYLQLVTALCRELCASLHRDEGEKDLVEDVELCISEACTNAIKHGSRDDGVAETTVRFRMEPDRVVIRVSDQGRGFELEHIPAPDLKSHPERGYGLYIIRSKMDRVRYVRDEAENYLEMTKFL